jgi:hypothetical protein
MRMRKVASLGDIVSSKSFARVRETTNRLATLEAILGLYLDAGLRAACRISSFSQGTLTLVTPQPAVAGHLRYLGRIFTQQLRQHGEFQTLERIRVLAFAPSALPETRKPRPPKRLSASTASLLRETALMLADPEISGALTRLARHGEGDSSADDCQPTPRKDTSH